jgi:hypothetical protein
MFPVAQLIVKPNLSPRTSQIYQNLSQKTRFKAKSELEVLVDAKLSSKRMAD